MPINPFTQDLAGQAVELPASEDFERSHHRWSQPELDALALAYAARRPLLVRGEPGSGKSQLARAAAKLLGAAPPLVEVIHPRFEPRDLLYRYDTIRRLADANAGVALTKDNEQNYVVRGKLWLAWEEAKKAPVVVLIDEVDKGESDVPNSLLGILGQRKFKVDEVPDMDTPKPEGQAPLILITTNEERELPAAFVRRCVVLNLNPPDDNDSLRQWLKERVEAHVDVVESLAAGVVDRALTQVLADRHAAQGHGYPKVGLAEALDLLTALAEITRDVPEAARAEQQLHWLNRISAYALVKHAGSDHGQTRDPVSAAVRADDADA